MAGVDVNLLLLVTLFLMGVWLAGRLFAVIKMPRILGELLAGIIMGPECFDLVPYASSGRCRKIFERRLAAISGNGSFDGSGDDCLSLHSWQGDHTVDIWSFAGTLGVTLLIMESGMHINFDKVAQVGGRALIVAIIGTAFPLLCGMLLTTLFFPGKLYPDGFAAGCSLAPTSVGISIKLLDESKMLNSMAGQTTLTAAFVDDVFSLVLLVLLNSLSQGNADPVLLGLNTILAFGFLGAGVALAKYVFPRLPALINRLPPSKGASIQPRDEAHLFVMLLSLTFFSWVGAILGSHLLGAFVAGMCFTKVPRSHAIWVAQFKRVTRWLIRVFFAATVGFAVPLRVMVTGDSALKVALGGLAFGALPGILCKIASGAAARVTFHGEEREQAAKASAATCGGRYQPIQYLVGCAMVARGEFAFLVAGEAFAMSYSDGEVGQKMLSEETYAMVLWSLLWALFCAPLLFNWALNLYSRANPVHRSIEIGGSPRSGQDFKIRITGDHHTGMLHEVIDTLHVEGLDIIEAHVEVIRGDQTSDEHVDSDVFIVRSRGKQKDFDSDKLHEMKDHLAELFGRHNSIITFEPMAASVPGSAREGSGELKPAREGIQAQLRKLSHTLKMTSPGSHEAAPTQSASTSSASRGETLPVSV